MAIDDLLSQAVNRLANPRDAAFGWPMLIRTAEIISELMRAGEIRPANGPDRAALLLWLALHGIVSPPINKDTHRLARTARAGRADDHHDPAPALNLR
jgi:hypothetical protein